MHPFHDGEREVQRRAGETAQAASNGRMISDVIAPGARPFIARQSLLIIGSVGPDGSPWASMQLGEPGFLTAEERSMNIDLTRAYRDPGDPLWQHLSRDPRLGLLVIEFGSRRRYRINGIAELQGDHLHLTVVEAYPNCPQYIHRRVPHSGEQRTVHAGDRNNGLTADDNDLIDHADTLFVASVAPRGMPDASHRGGRPGFVERQADGRLRIPDLPGNGLFNTWGNLAREPRVGVVIPDFSTGKLLQIAGTADLQWEQPDPTGQSNGTGRFWMLRPTRIRATTLPVVIDWEGVG